MTDLDIIRVVEELRGSFAGGATIDAIYRDRNIALA
jgi:hypothetical protein